MTTKPNSKGQYRVNYKGLICIATQIVIEGIDAFNFRNHKGEEKQEFASDVLSSDQVICIFFSNFTPHI